MRVTTTDTRTLAVALVRPDVEFFWNWAASCWEAGPFVPASHARPMMPLKSLPSVQSAELGRELAERDDAVPQFFDVSGSTYSPTDTGAVFVGPAASRLAALSRP